MNRCLNHAKHNREYLDPSWRERYNGIERGGLMIIYHGSTVPVQEPKIFNSGRTLDFGSGFYATYNREQSMRWAERVAVRRNTDSRFITEYEFAQEDAKRQLRIVSFVEPDEKWLDFICSNRSGRTPDMPYDIAIGPVANDVVYTAVALYEQGLLDKDEAIKRLKVQKLYSQILFHTEASLQFCKYIRHEMIGG